MTDLLENKVANKRVILGLSGGVDSAVAAILLQQAGAEVHALHMTNWEDDDGYCTAADDLQDARDVCEQLEIPLHHLQNGALLIFAFFMISDPKTTPNTALGRIIYATIVASIAFVIQFVLYQPNGPILALIISAPLVPIIDFLRRGRNYEWTASQFNKPTIAYVHPDKIKGVS